jgi:hypothetical protein
VACPTRKIQFFIFLLHAPVLLAPFMLYKAFFAFVPSQIDWLAAPLLITGLLIAVYKLGMMYGAVNFAASLASRPRGQRSLQSRANTNPDSDSYP